MALALVFAAASLLISGFSFIYLLGYLRRRTGARRILDDFEEEVNKLIAGIDAAADRDITLLEDKSAALKALLETLDRRIATYARELDRREKQETAYAALGRGIRSSLRVSPPEPPPAAAPGNTDQSGVVETPDPAEPEPEEPFEQPRFIRSPTPVKPKIPLVEQARELCRNGFSPETIAIRLGATLAEIDLALALPDFPMDPPEQRGRAETE
jgi:hypothetical protein